MVPAAGPGVHMIQCQVMGNFSAVLTGVTVAPENLLPRETPSEDGTSYLVIQPDNRRNGKGGASGVENTTAILQHLGAFVKEQDDGPPRAADVEWLVVLIEDQNS